MFCNYCGASNPNDVPFCSSCGRAVAGSRANAPASKETPAQVPIPGGNEAPKITQLVPATALPTGARPTNKAPKKKRGVGWKWIVMGLIFVFIVFYPLKDGGSICDATKNVAVQQVPDAVEILAARHPLQVGLLRSLFNDQGAVDKIAEEYVRTSMLRRDPGTLNCYFAYYVVIFNKDAIRRAEADWMEKQLPIQ